MRKIVLVFVAMTVMASVHAQTRRIAHRNHGGSNRERYNGRDGNYGTTPEMYARMDSMRKAQDSIYKAHDSIRKAYYLKHDSVMMRLDTVQAPDSLKSNQPQGSIEGINEMGRVCTRFTGSK